MPDKKAEAVKLLLKSDAAPHAKTKVCSIIITFSIYRRTHLFKYVFCVCGIKIKRKQTQSNFYSRVVQPQMPRRRCAEL